MSIVKDFYKGQTLFVTGGTGFMGKVLLEKLLRSLPEINKIYILMRSNKGLTPQQRISEFTRELPFTLNSLTENDFKKLVPIQGDISKTDLGLSEENKSALLNEVNVVFHLAASVRMNLGLKDAIQQNTVATLRVLEMCSKMKKLVSLVHLSTAYCNIEIEYMEEKIYKTDVEPLDFIKDMKHLDEKSLNQLERKILKKHPNTYTFSKRLAEIIVWDYGRKLPIVICRPSIVTPALREPTPGWVDNFNGPVGILLAAGKGILRSAVVDRNCIPQVVPVDIAINSLIVCGWFRATSKFLETPIYNVTNSNLIKFTWGDICDKFRKIAFENPFKTFLWYPVCTETTNIWFHNIIVLFFHMIPAYFIDLLLVLFLRKPFLVRTQKKLNTGMKLLQYFAVRPWTFTNCELMKIKGVLKQEDLREFYFFEEDIDFSSYIRDCYFGSRKYCLKENWDNVSFQKIIYRVLMCIEYSGRIAILYALLWSFLYMFNATNILSLDYWTQSTTTLRFIS